MKFYKLGMVIIRRDARSFVPLHSSLSLKRGEGKGEGWSAGYKIGIASVLIYMSFKTCFGISIWEY